MKRRGPVREAVGNVLSHGLSALGAAVYTVAALGELGRAVQGGAVVGIVGGLVAGPLGAIAGGIVGALVVHLLGG